MRQMTLRDIPDDIETLARNEARRQGVSLNKAFLSLLRTSVQHNRARVVSTDDGRNNRFSRFCGVWTDAEAAEFDASLIQQRSVDNEMWQ